MPIYERAKNIIAELDTRGIGRRPLALVCHSLGGLVVKRVLQAADSVLKEDFPLFATSTKLVVFIATPHSGSALANVLDWCVKLSRTTELVTELRRGAAELTASTEWFERHVKETRLRVSSFHEMKPTGLITVVQPADARLGGCVSIGVPADHEEICKPRREDLVAGRTKTFLDEFCISAGENQAAASVAPDNRRILSFETQTGVDPTCIHDLISKTGEVLVTYHQDIMEKIAILRYRESRLDEYLRRNPHYRDAPNQRAREEIASSLSWANRELLRMVREQVDYHASGLSRLLAYIQGAGAASQHIETTLRTFSAIAALLMIKVLKHGGERDDEQRRYAWFDDFAFPSHHTGPCLFERAPLWSALGDRVFGAGRWVTARVGQGESYESVMVPLDDVVDIFKQHRRGDQDLFHKWILPQLFILFGSYFGPGAFLAREYEVILVTGDKSKEYGPYEQIC